jgi:GntR family transcriptional regulator
VVRKRGIGTFVSNEPLNVNNLSINWGVTQVIRSVGAIPGTLEMEVSVLPSDPYVSSRLSIRENTPLLFVERVRTANERRVVFTQDYIPVDLLQGLKAEDPAVEVSEFLNKNHSLYTFVENFLSRPVHHAIARISPLTADEVVAKKLNINIGSGILYLEQVDSDSDGSPLWMAREHHAANAFTFTVYRNSF